MTFINKKLNSVFTSANYQYNFIQKLYICKYFENLNDFGKFFFMVIY